MATTLDLNGPWRFWVDQDPEYHCAADYSLPLSLEHWLTVPVPACWNTYAERYDLYEGVAWFVREFEVPELPTQPVARLHFGGVNYLAEVHLNGQLVGTHEGGYTAFALDVSDALREGRNRLAVRVDNRRLKLRLPALLGWYNYGGLHREVSLKLTSRAQITGLRVEARPAGAGTLGEVGVRVSSGGPGRTLALRIVDGADRSLWEARVPIPANRVRLPLELAEALPWSPESPYLYRCVAQLWDGPELLDEADCRFGVREVSVRGEQILLNGEPRYLRGLCYLYDHPRTGMTFDRALVTADLDDLQALGVNCLRSHHPPPEWFLSECDARGLLLWVEAPIYCVAGEAGACGPGLGDASLRALALQMIEEMVERAAGHPSVILWSVGNECGAGHPEAPGFFAACVARVRSLDATRLVGYASLYGDVGCLADLADVVGINEYWGWYDRIDSEGRTDESTDKGPPDLRPLEACLQEKSALGKPLLLTEFGADAEPGRRSPAGELWSEDYQAALLEAQLRLAARFPAVCGTFPFLYSDYRDPSKPVNAHWHGLNLKGVVDYHRRRKLAWETLRRFYAQAAPAEPPGTG